MKMLLKVQSIVLLIAISSPLIVWGSDEIPMNLRVVLENTQPLDRPRSDRLPLYVLPITNSLSGLSDADAENLLKQLDQRGIGYSVDWHPHDFKKSAAEALRIGRIQKKLRLDIAVNANACLYSFFDGSPETLHMDADGKTFADGSLGGNMGCPFALAHRIPAMKKRIEPFLKAYQSAGLKTDFVFADWEIDGPIEWNDAWGHSKKCERCRQNLKNIHDFRAFQKQLRSIRSRLQREVFGDLVTTYFPQALVGNYATYPHDGLRYWYDYFEVEPSSDLIPIHMDQKAPYREWAHEFRETGYTFSMPVVYTWYRTFDWYDFADSDYRWFYNMLKVGSNAGKHTPPNVPIIPFVHWTTTAPPKKPASRVQQFSKQKYKELLWHLLLRGHDTFFLWCVSNELATEIELVHEVYAKSQPYQGFFHRGTPISFHVPNEPSTIVSGLRLGNQVLVKRTDFGSEKAAKRVSLSADEYIKIPISDSPLIVAVLQNDGTFSDSEVHPTSSIHPTVSHRSVARPIRHSGFLDTNHGPVFPIGTYEHPKSDMELQRMAGAGINLVRCSNRKDLDRVHKAGMKGWISLGVQQGATDGLKNQILSFADHPALAVWEGPDEIVWMFTAYSGLKNSAGFTRQDWESQTNKAVEYSEKHGPATTANMRAGIQLVKQLDKRNLPFWVNEAADSDVKFVRQYVDSIEITGCDYYAVRSEGSDLQSVGRLVDRWSAIGRQRPVWMVLQAFSWHSIKSTRKLRYPTFEESRFMAYDSIVHGAKGILYWGSWEITNPGFRQSLYALTSELSAIQSFLVAPSVSKVDAHVIDDLFDPPGRGIRVLAKQRGEDLLVLIVNEDAHRHLGVDITGLRGFEGKQLDQLYGQETVTVEHGGFVTRLQGFQVKLFSTDASCVSQMKGGREFTK